MKFALIDGEKTEPSKSLKGKCPSCNGLLDARCGEVRIHHWAHRGKRHCDPWWENETEWHRNWKNQFPVAWQEQSFSDPETNERHIADVISDSGLVIEFQHSFINSEEQVSREKFYKNIIWVVDGTRLKNDIPRFLKEKDRMEKTHMPGVFLTNFPSNCFHKAWRERPKIVIFDFEGVNKENRIKEEGSVWCLLPGEVKGRAVVICLAKKDFVDYVHSNKLIESLRAIYKNSKEYRELMIKQIILRERRLLQKRQSLYLKQKRYATKYKGRKKHWR